jgi:hypothetical protein
MVYFCPKVNGQFSRHGSISGSEKEWSTTYHSISGPEIE